jgi:hypothetical protein
MGRKTCQDSLQSKKERTQTDENPFAFEALQHKTNASKNEV